MSKKYIVIVESPGKSKTIQEYLGQDYEILACLGHIRDLPKNQLGIELEKEAYNQYDVIPDKKDIVKLLKKKCSTAEHIYIATDPDREGEAIAWHLDEVLDVDASKTSRVVFNEITKSAVINAINNPRKIDMNLVNAQQARRSLDRIVGFELSPVLWRKIRTGLSAGRVQSVAVKLIVEREREIREFNSTSYFKLTADFLVNDIEVKAEIKEKIETKKEAQSILDECKKSKLVLNSITSKIIERKPGAPFTTSTLQQQAFQKFNFSVKKTMSVAQRLYEAGHITYMRTDSASISEEFHPHIEHFVNSQFGSNYYKKTIYKTKSSSAQEAHEAVRPTTLANEVVSDDTDQQKLYSLIRSQTIASQMAAAKIKTLHTIFMESILIPNTNRSFQAEGDVIEFDGFLRVIHSDQKKALPQLNDNDPVNIETIKATEKFTRPPSRYTEAKLVKTLEELEIGRPSTYAPTITTITKRGYVSKDILEGEERKFTVMALSNNTIDEHIDSEITGAESNKLIPKDIGFLVNDFLVDQFENILDYKFTANLENEFDHIALGKKNWHKMVTTFYQGFHKEILDVKENAARVSGERLLGQDPKTNKNVYVRMGRFGPIAQLGEPTSETQETKPTFAGLKPNQSLDTITLTEALELFKLPRIIGQYENETVTAAVGRFGPYLKYKNLFVSLKKIDPLKIELDEAITLIEEKIENEKNKFIHIFKHEKDEIQVLNGPYGPYIKAGKRNVKIPKGVEPKSLTLEKCLEIINTKSKNTKNKKTKK